MKRVSYILVLILLISGCSNPDIVRKDLDEVIQLEFKKNPPTQSDISFPFCNMFVMEWDRIWIVPPYSGDSLLNDIKAKGFPAIRSEVKENANAENKFQYIAVHLDKVVAYGSVSIYVLNLSFLRNHDEPLFSFKKSDCQKFYIDYYPTFKNIPILKFRR